MFSVSASSGVLFNHLSVRISDKEEAVAKLRILLDKAIARRTEAQEDVDQLISLIKQLM